MFEERAAFESGADFNSRIRLTPPHIEVSRLRSAIRNGDEAPDIQAASLLVLDATPVEPLVAHHMQDHRRLQDVGCEMTLPSNVRFVQYARRT